ncbi:MAG TPA: DegT/DnrJ/EryC1/StrS family aminotransferase [bacterium]|nr:DegT/DnrJ/EryC1/StrS family aminotransferase [bacterium]HOL47822.1 DegT/DnrJ/EryC1/StrS family aminotransferase [bacterium]HPQ19942.1 DegT/DnrJ/EryC1/StrS family aminotransferase [bacterium]
MKIPFEIEFRKKYYKLLDEVFDSNFLSEGKMVDRFEDLFSEYTKLYCAAVCNGGAALEAILRYIDIKNKDVIVQSNNFICDVFAVKKNNGNVIFADCSKKDLCLDLQSLKDKVTQNTKAVILTHIGGHLSFEISEIADFCEKQNIYLIEDCAHSHGATYNERHAGSFGFAGFYSFYSTKTMPLGEGGMVVSKNKDIIDWVKKYRNYGKFEYKIEGFNCRMNEITAAFGIIQMERLPMILEWKNQLAEKYNQIFNNRIKFPKGMKSGYYKYIIFDTKLKEETGKVFGEPCHIICKSNINLPNTEWVAEHHCCPPIYYGWEHFDKSVEEIRDILLVR